MAWTRLFTTSFEEQYSGELSNYYFYGSIQAESTLPHTQSQSLNVISQKTLPAVDNFGTWNQVRSNYWFYVGSPFSTDPSLFGLHSLETLASPADDPTVFWFYDISADQFYIEQHAIEIARWSPYVSPGYEIGQWCALSMVAKAGLSGYLSCYVNGILQMKVDLNYIPDIRAVSWAGGSFNGTFTDFYMDDVYVDGSNADEVDSAPPSPRFYLMPIHASGSTTEWDIVGGDDRAAALAAAPKEINDNPILLAAAAGLEERLRIHSIEGFDDYKVEAVILKARAMCGDLENPASINFLVDDFDGNSLASSDLALEAAYSMKFNRFALRPDGDPWTLSMADIEVGIRSVDNVAGDLPEPSSTWITASVVNAETQTLAEAQAMEVDFADDPQASIIFQDQRLSGSYNIAGNLGTRDPILARLPAFTSLRVGAWASRIALLGAGTIFALRDAANTALLHVGFDRTKKILYARVGSGSLQNITSISLTPIYRHRDWVHYGWFINPTTMSFYLNGVRILTHTRSVGDATAAVQLSAFRGNNTAVSASIDDFYMDYSLSTETDAPPPMRRFESFYVNSFGSLNEWQGGSGNANPPFEIVPNQTDYMLGKTTGLSALFPTAPVPFRPGWLVRGLGLYAYANRDTITSLKALWELDGVTTERTMQPVSNTDSGWWAYDGYSEIAPDGDAWDQAKVSRAQIGVKTA